MMAFTRIRIVGLLALLAVPPAGQAACGGWAPGPLELPSRAIVQSTRLGPVPASARTEAPGMLQLRASGSWLNHWGRDNQRLDPSGGDIGRFQVDMETADAVVAAQAGISDGLQAGVAVRHRRRFGGVMDQPIEEFHDLLGFYNAERELFEQDQFRVFLSADQRDEVVELSADQAGAFEDALTVHLQQRLRCGGGAFPEVAVRVSLQTADHRDLDSSAPSVGMTLLAEHAINRWRGYVQIGSYWHGANRFRGLRLNNWQYGAMVGLRVALPRRVELLGQLLYGSSPVAGTFEPVSDPTVESMYGLRWWAARHHWIEVAMVEGLSRFNSTPDVGWFVSWGSRWDWAGGR